MTPTELKQIREVGGLCIHITLTTDAERVYKSLASRDLKIPTERILLGHIAWIRQMIELGIINVVQWCDTRDMTSDGHTKGSIDRELLLGIMCGQQAHMHPVKSYKRHSAAELPTNKYISF